MINWEQFTVDNGAITDLKDLLFLQTFEDPDLEKVTTQKTEVESGQKLDYVDTMQDVGVKGGGCDPEYEKVKITGVEKEWELGTWEVAEYLCYADIENTIGKAGLKAGTDKADLQDTPYWDTVLMPLLQRVMKQMFWRMVWFGDKQAKNVSQGGVITDGVKTKLFTTADGLWKRIFAVCAANSRQRTTIAANAQSTLAAQMAAIKVEGTAIGIVDDLLQDADSRIFDDDQACLIMTNSLFKALRNDVYKRVKCTLTVEQITKGIALSEYDGTPIIVLDIWDRMIKKYETIITTTGEGDNAVTTERVNNPHRAIVVSPKNLFVGTEDKDKIASLSIKFDDITRKNHIYASSTIGTLIGEDALLQAAY